MISMVLGAFPGIMPLLWKSFIGMMMVILMGMAVAVLGPWALGSVAKV